MPGGSAAKVVFQKPARPTYVKMILKARRLQEDCRRANYLKAGSRRSGERPSFDANLSFRLDLFRGKPQRPLSAPVGKPISSAISIAPLGTIVRTNNFCDCPIGSLKTLQLAKAYNFIL